MPVHLCTRMAVGKTLAWSAILQSRRGLSAEGGGRTSSGRKGYDFAPSLPALAGAGQTVVEHANALLFLPCPSLRVGRLRFDAVSLRGSGPYPQLRPFPPGSTAL